MCRIYIQGSQGWTQSKVAQLACSLDLNDQLGLFHALLPPVAPLPSPTPTTRLITPLSLPPPPVPHPLLPQVVKEKHGAEKPSNATNIICKVTGLYVVFMRCVHARGGDVPCGLLGMTLLGPHFSGLAAGLPIFRGWEREGRVLCVSSHILPCHPILCCPAVLPGCC